MARYSGTLTDQYLRPIAGALVSVTRSVTDQAATLTTDAGQPLDNPFPTDEAGLVVFNTPDDYYDLVYHYGGRTIRQDFGVAVGTATIPAGSIVDALGSGTDIAASQNAVTNALTAKASSTDLAAPTGASLIGFTRPENGAVTRTVLSKLLDFVSVKDFGAKGDGATNDTAAFLAAFATGKIVYAPAGTYILDTLDIPGVMGFELWGEGATRTILQASAANQPILRKEQVDGVVEGGHIGGFSLQAHASGSTGPAFDFSGFRNVKLERILGLSNGTKGFQSLFDVSASPYVTYGCTWEHCGLDQQAGWDNVWLFNNRGTSAVNNANAHRIISPWIYANTGLAYGIDAGRSAMVSILGGLIEGNTGATALRVGQATFVQGMWLESNAADVEYANLADGVANDGMFLNNYFSTPHTIDMTGVSRNIWIGNREPTGAAWSNNDGTNIKVKPPAGGVSAPTAAYTSGTSGTLTALGATRLADPNLVNQCVYEVPYTWAASSASGQSIFTITPPTGWTVASVSASAFHDGTKEPAKVAITSPTTISLTNAFTNNHTIMLFVTLVAT